jgi:hypothetical protein
MTMRLGRVRPLKVKGSNRVPRGMLGSRCDRDA